MANMEVNILDVLFKNPVITASGTFGFGREYADYFDLSRLGGISSKGLTLNKKDGNKGIRLHETASGLLNSIGLQNPGLDAFIKDELPFMKEQGTVILANVGGGTLEDYLRAVEKLNIPYANQLGVIIVTILLTYFTLVFGELVPKRIALKNKEKVALSSVKTIYFVLIITKPFVKILSFSTTLILKIYN